MTVYHPVQEEGVALREIAETIAKWLKIPAVSQWRTGGRALWMAGSLRGPGHACIE